MGPIVTASHIMVLIQYESWIWAQIGSSAFSFNINQMDCSRQAVYFLSVGQVAHCLSSGVSTKHTRYQRARCLFSIPTTFFYGAMNFHVRKLHVIALHDNFPNFNVDILVFNDSKKSFVLSLVLFVKTLFQLLHKWTSPIVLSSRDEQHAGFSTWTAVRLERTWA